MTTKDEQRVRWLIEKLGAIPFGDRVITEQFILKDAVLLRFYQAAFNDGVKSVKAPPRN